MCDTKFVIINKEMRQDFENCLKEIGVSFKEIFPEASFTSKYYNQFCQNSGINNFNSLPYSAVT